MEVSHIVLISVFSLTFITPILVWISQECKKVQWERIYRLKSVQAILDYKDQVLFYFKIDPEKETFKAMKVYFKSFFKLKPENNQENQTEPEP